MPPANGSGATSDNAVAASERLSRSFPAVPERAPIATWAIATEVAVDGGLVPGHVRRSGSVGTWPSEKAPTGATRSVTSERPVLGGRLVRGGGVMSADARSDSPLQSGCREARAG